MSRSVNKPTKSVKRRGKQAEIARRAGKSRALITRKAKQGKLVCKDGEIDVDASVTALKAEDSVRNAPSPDAIDVDALEKRILDDVEQSGETFADAQRRKEVALADLRELELAQKRGQLIEVDVAARFLANASKATTNQLLAVPEKVAPLIAATNDVRQCRDLVLKEIKQALENLPDKIPVPESAA